MAKQSKKGALEILNEGQRLLGELFQQLSDDELVMPATIGGGDWSAKDLMGHIAFWEELAREAAVAWPAGRRSQAEDIFARKSPGIDAANAENQARTSAQTLRETRARAAATHETLLETIGALTDEQWTATGPAESEPDLKLGVLLGRITGASQRPFGHAWAHLDDLRSYAASR